ncbi:NADH:ubiquinone oxidoreductase, partial [Ceratobasidium sp. 392]
TMVKEIKEKAVVVQNAAGERVEIPFGTIVWAAGNVGRPITRNLMGYFPEHQTNRRGITVDDFLSMKGADGIFAVGDCTATSYAPTAQVASQEGTYLARLFGQIAKKEKLEKRLAELRAGPQNDETAADIESVVKQINKASKIRPFHYSHQGSLAYIGSEKAIADLPFLNGNFASGGMATYLFWRSAYLSNLFSLRNRVLVLNDWLKVKIFGRHWSNEDRGSSVRRVYRKYTTHMGFKVTFATAMVRHSDNGHFNLPSRVFAISELARIIHSFADKADTAKLLHLSRHFFDLMVPIVWEDMDLKPVLMLIPDVVVLEHRNNVLLGLSFELPATLDTTRLDFYGQYVSTLTAAIPYTVKFPQGRPTIGEQVLSKPLLPNLQRLVVNTRGSVRNEHVDWIPKLLSPNVKGFEMRSVYATKTAGVTGHDLSAYPWLDYKQCLKLLDEVFLKCPTIKNLRIFPTVTESASSRIPAFCQKIAKFQHLSSLTVGAGSAGSEILQTLGQFPALESLSLVSDTFLPGPNEISTTWLDKSFPVLRRLNLFGINPRMVEGIRRAPQLFRMLTTVFITVGRRRMNECAQTYYAIRLLEQNSSQIVDLTILGTNYPFPCFRSFVKVIGKMPLRRLRLGAVELNPDIKAIVDTQETGMTGLKKNSPVLNWEEFLAAVPHLEVLRLDDQRLELSRLQTFASALPKLQLLSLWALDDPHAPERIFNLVGYCQATQPIIIECSRFEGSLKTEISGSESYYVSSLARYLTSLFPESYELTHIYSYISGLWPKVTFKANTDWLLPQVDHVVTRLNDAIKLLRERV